MAGTVLLWKCPWGVVTDCDKSPEQQLSTVNLSENPQNPGMLPGTFSSPKLPWANIWSLIWLTVLRQTTFLSLFQAEIKTLTKRVQAEGKKSYEKQYVHTHSCLNQMRAWGQIATWPYKRSRQECSQQEWQEIGNYFSWDHQWTFDKPNTSSGSCQRLGTCKGIGESAMQNSTPRTKEVKLERMLGQQEKSRQ